MEVEITKERENQLLRRKEVLFRLRYEEEGASPSREEARNALIKALKCSPNLLVIDKMGTEFGKRETVGYAKVYGSEERLKEIEREHIIERNFGGSGKEKSEGKVREEVDSMAAIHTFYEVVEEKGKVKTHRKRKVCPRCGSGVFLAEHEDRYSCGKCGYTEFRKKS